MPGEAWPWMKIWSPPHGSSRPAEEVVEADFVERGRRGVGRDVAADADAGALRAVHGQRGVPADPAAVAALDLFVTGELGLVLGRDGVDVVRRRDLRHVELQLVRLLQEAQHDLAASPGALRLHELQERLLPLGGLFGVAVERSLGVRILIVDSHKRPFVIWQVMPGIRHRDAVGFVHRGQCTADQPTSPRGLIFDADRPCGAVGGIRGGEHAVVAPAGAAAS